MFTVDVSHLDDDQLVFFGWTLAKETADFWLYVHIRTGEEQIVDKSGPRCLVVDDVNDAQQMAKDRYMIVPTQEKHG